MKILRNALSGIWTLVFALVLTALASVGTPGVGIASAHSSYGCQPGTSFCIGGSAGVPSVGIPTALGYCDTGYSANALEACVFTGNSFGYGSFGARYFGPHYGFGQLAAAQTSTDAEACSNTLAWLSTLDTNDKRQAIAAGIVSQLQACENNTGSTPSSTNCGPFACFGFGPGGWFRRF